MNALNQKEETLGNIHQVAAIIAKRQICLQSEIQVRDMIHKKK